MVKRNGSGERKERENKRSEIGNIFLNIGIRTEKKNKERNKEEQKEREKGEKGRKD